MINRKRAFLRYVAAFLLPLIAVLLMAEAISAEETRVKIGVLCPRGTEECMNMWTPTAEYLSKEIPGYRFEIVPLDNDTIGPVVTRGDVDFISTNPGSYVELEESYGASRLATLVVLQKGETNAEFGATILVRADRDDINELGDLKGKSFMAVHEKAFGGWWMAWWELKEQGIDPYSDFSNLAFSGFPQDIIVYAVRDGDVDAGTVRTGILEQMAADGKIELADFRVLNQQQAESFPFMLSTRLYPEWPFAKAVDTNDDLAKQVAVALLQMPPDSDAAKAMQSAGWTAPLDYSLVHQCLRDLGVSIYEDYGKVSFSEIIRRYSYWIASSVILILLLFGTALMMLKLNRSLVQSRHNLQQSRNQLEVKVRERTAELDELMVRYRLLFEQSPDAVLLISGEGRFLEVSQTAVDRYGYSREELLGMGPVDLAALDLRTETPARVRKAMAADERFEWRHRRKDGSELPVDISARPVEIGGAHCILSTVRDISERRQAEEALVVSEERFRNLFKNSPLMLFALDTDGKVLTVNTAAVEQMGYPADELVGQSVLKVFHPEDRKTVLGQVGQLLKSESLTGSWITKKVRKDGTEIWVNEVARLMEWPDGRQVILVSCEDITERRLAEKALQESEERFRSFFELTADLVCISDIKGYFRELNQAWEKTLGYSIQELTDKPYFEFILPEDRDSTLQVINEQLERGETVLSFENRYMRKDGGYVWLEWNSRPMPEQDQTFAIARDITERKQAEEELKKHREHLEVLVKMRTSDLEEKNSELRYMNKLFVGRELRIDELKQEIRKYKGEAGMSSTIEEGDTNDPA